MKSSGVYQKSDNSWITFLRIDRKTLIKVSSVTQKDAQLKYNMLAQLYFNNDKRNYNVVYTEVEYKKCSKSLLIQLNNCKSKNQSEKQQGKSELECKSSKYVGVHLFKRTQTFQSRLVKDNINCNLGYYKDEDIAGEVYNEAAKLAYGDLATLNDIVKKIELSEKTKIDIYNKVKEKFNI